MGFEGIDVKKPRKSGLSTNQIAAYAASRRTFLAKPYFDSQCHLDWYQDDVILAC